MSAKTYTSEEIRNVAVIGHSATGKTSVISALLFDSGTVNRFCKTDDGNAITDFDEDEIERKISINTAIAHCEHRGTKINLIDTPGYSIYTTDAVQGMRVADSALMTISAVAGIEVQTEKLWKMAAEFSLPVILAMNMMDRDRASFERTLGVLQSKYGREVVPLQLPIGEESAFEGVVDLISGKAMTFVRDESGKMTTGDVPDGMADEVAAAREALMEMVAEQDEEMMEAYLEAGELDEDSLRTGLAKAFQARDIFPVLAMAAGKNIAIQPVMDVVVDLVPPPTWRPFTAREDEGEELELTPDSTQPAAAYVFKTFADPYTGRITLLRVFDGTIVSDATLGNLDRDSNERLGSLAVMQGKELEPVAQLAAGDLGAVPKLKETLTGDTLCDPQRLLRLPPVAVPEPAISFALEPRSKGDEDKLATGLVKIRDEDPTIKIGRDPQTKELLVSGTGQLHVEVMVARLKRRYKVDVLLHQPKVPYRETIVARAEATARHKKQTGGHGQFAECKITIEPVARDAGYEFVDKIFGGSISQGYRPAVDKGIQEAAATGYLAGFPVVDFRVTLIDGKEHPVDSSEMAFKIAGRKVFRECMDKARPTMLEPIMKVGVFTPDDFMGDVMGDLNSRRGRVQGMDSEDGTTVVRAMVPQAEMLTYSPTLRSITGGRADYQMEFSHYEEVPKQLQTKIIAAATKDEADDDE